MSEHPLNYPVGNPNNPGTLMPRYPVDNRERATPGSSAHAYIDYLEGCIAQTREFIDAATQLQALGLTRLATLEKAHADLNTAFHRRCLEFEARLDNAAQRIDGLETSLGPKAPY